MQSNEEILCCILDIGEILLTAGAEVSRVEDTTVRIARAYGFVRTDVVTVTEFILITARAEDGQILTQVRRIAHRQNNMGRIEAVNALSREICASPVPLPDLENRLRIIQETPSGTPGAALLAYLLAAGSFTVFFGGSLCDSFAAMLCSIVLYAIDRVGSRIRLQPFVLTVANAAALSISALVLARLGLGKAVDKVIIGNIMILIPGLALVTSLRDLISGDVISGLLGAIEALLRAAAIAAGCALVLMNAGGVI